MEKYHYFVVYRFHGGYKDCDVTTNKKITRYEDIKEIVTEIAKDEPENEICILNYKLIGKY